MPGCARYERLISVEEKVEVCASCGKRAPKTETEYTLISARYGWRLTREKSKDGNYSVKWHCPACWRTLKAASKPPRLGGA